jgi:hypothetical protein
LRGAANTFLGTTVKYLRGVAGIGLGTTINNLRLTASCDAGNGPDSTVKYLRRTKAAPRAS